MPTFFFFLIAFSGHTDNTLFKLWVEMGGCMKQLPRRIIVKQLLQGRYPDGRPHNWDFRVDGRDRVLTTDGETIELASLGQQSSPQPGWEILLTDKDSNGRCRWTLYGIKTDLFPVASQSHS